MKNAYRAITLLSICVGLFSCGTFNIRTHYDGADEKAERSKAALLYYDETLSIYKANDSPVD